MTRKRIIRPAAQAEIDSQAAYLAEHASEVVAHRFLAAVDETVATLLRAPGIGSPWTSDNPQLQRIRRHRIAGFPNHLLFYRHDDQRLEVLHLYHGKQDIETCLEDEAGAAEDAT